MDEWRIEFISRRDAESAEGVFGGRDFRVLNSELGVDSHVEPIERVNTG